MDAQLATAEYTTMDGVIGFMVLGFYLGIMTLTIMFSSTAIIYSEWMGSKVKHPLLSFISNMLHPLFAMWIWGK